MGAWRHKGKAALCAVFLLAATRAAASTVVEPIARLGLEGGYDSNAMFDGSGGDRMGRVSPDFGLRLYDRRWDLRATYGGDLLYYDRLAPEGVWNHRATFTLRSRVTRRATLDLRARGAVTTDPIGLVMMGVFRPGRDAATLLVADGKLSWRGTRRLDLAGTFRERTAIFEDGTGGAMHAPGAEALLRFSRRLSIGGAYGLSLFQGFEPDRTDLSWSHAARARGTYRINRRLTLDAYAGPALWHGDGDFALVPEAAVELTGSSRAWDFRTQLAHGLGISTLGRPGLVDSVEFGASRRFKRRYEIRGDGGLWHSGRAPDGDFAVTGFAVAGEAAVLVGGGVRLAIGATHFARIDDPSAAFARTTLGLRLGWELPHR
jgi:hypothetical protein